MNGDVIIWIIGGFAFTIIMCLVWAYGMARISSGSPLSFRVGEYKHKRKSEEPDTSKIYTYDFESSKWEWGLTIGLIATLFIIIVTSRYIG